MGGKQVRNMMRSFCLLVIVFVGSTAYYNDTVNALVIRPTQGCILPEDATSCSTGDGETTVEITTTDIVAEGCICQCKDSNSGLFLRECFKQNLAFVWIDLSVEGISRQKRSDFAMTGLSVGGAFGTMFGPEGSVIGAAIGGVVGLIGDIVCAFLCDKPDPPPPNHPPSLVCAALEGPNTIMAGTGKNTVVVKWSEPTATDPEDGELSVNVIPESFQSGSEFSEGTYVVSFRASDRQGLADVCAISFSVKVLRCSPPRWPRNGNQRCTGYVLGSRCTFTCNAGYELDTGKNGSIQCINAGTSGSWTADATDCVPKECKAHPDVHNGVLFCPRNKAVFGSTCTVECNDGYKRNGSPFMSCDKLGNWNSPPTCKDNTMPAFTSCPNDVQVNIDSSNNTAKVTWDLPTGTDNSGEQPYVTEKNNYKPGQRFQAGSHSVKYQIRDSNGNQGFPCTFIVQVQTINCQPPSLNVEGAQYMAYDCPDFYRLGAVCTLSCRSGYPLGGVTQIQCLNDGSDPPNLQWHWDNNGLDPFCKVTMCPDLPAPTNGALACSLWDHGNMCQLQCQKGFDVPLIRDGMYVCGTSDGKWRPDDNVPDCNPTHHANRIHLKSEFFYFTGKCNSSAVNLQQIKDNFVTALNSSKYHEQCVGVPECRAEFVNVTCGPTTSRRRRDTAIDIGKRSTLRMAYRVTFNLILPLKPTLGKSMDTIITENQNMLYDMSDAIQVEVDSGHFDMPGKDMAIETDSFGPGTPELACPKGTMPKTATASCAGCPTGRFYSEATQDCQYCPVGTYQDEPYSMSCKQCPSGFNTTQTGATDLQMCREYCQVGFHSTTGLSPCSPCDSTSYQPQKMSTSCLPCSQGTRSKLEGSTSNASCLSYDIRLEKATPFKVVSNTQTAALTFSSWLLFVKENEGADLFIVKSSDGRNSLKISWKQKVLIDINGQLLDTGKVLHSSKWYHIAMAVDLKTTSLAVYINGKSVYNNSAITTARTSLVKTGDTLEIQGDVQLSSYRVLDGVAGAADVAKWSSTCESSFGNAFLTSDIIATSNNATVILPSKCDAVDECESSPCGRHDCVNKLGGFECHCLDGFSGDRCQTKPDYCMEHACQHGATCVDGPSNYTCSCVYGYSGEHCQYKAVGGGWSKWTEWAKCSKSCGGGTSVRSRECNNPPPDVEGAPCQGPTSESANCNTEICPECKRLMRSYGVLRSCNTTGSLTRCTISCRTGLYFTTPPLPYYECGAITGYKWNHENKDNPHARLPGCSEVKPPVQMSVAIDGHYKALDCTRPNGAAVVTSLQTKMSSLACVQDGSCEADITSKDCNDVTRKKRSAPTLTVTVHLKSSVKTNGSDFNFSSVIANQSAPSPSLVDFLKQTVALEKSAQQLFNNSVDIFKVTVNGKIDSVRPGYAGVTVTPSIRCPPGSVRLDVFCAESPVGSYSDGYKVHLCPEGQYQDQTGQSTCKPCPKGKSTQGIGSVHISECEDIKDDGGEKHSDASSSGTSDGAKIAIGVCVSIALLALAGAAIVVAYKYVNKRHRRVSDSTGDLHNMYPDTYVVPSKTTFQKSLI